MDHIQPVVWNRQAIENLVMDDGTKDLIKALVSNQIQASHSTDFIPGKGDGLTILLHGYDDSCKPTEAKD